MIEYTHARTGFTHEIIGLIQDRKAWKTGKNC